MGLLKIFSFELLEEYLVEVLEEFSVELWSEFLVKHETHLRIIGGILRGILFRMLREISDRSIIELPRGTPSGIPGGAEAGLEHLE